MQAVGNQNSGPVRNQTSSPPQAPSQLQQGAAYGAQIGSQNFRFLSANEQRPAPPVASWNSRPIGDSYRTAWDNVAARLGTQNPIAVRTEIERQLYQAQGLDGYRVSSANNNASNYTSNNINATNAAATPASNSPAGNSNATPSAGGGPDPVQLGLDLTQMGLDIVGIFEPAPFADASNTLISLGRGAVSIANGNWGEAGGHGLNGLLSAIGIIPYAGDAAKLGKIGKWAQTVADTISAIAHNPAMRSALEPGLRAVKDAVDGIPQSALDSLPQSARESIEGMKRQLDEFFGAGASTANRVENGTLMLGANRGASTTINGRTVTIGDTPPVTRQGTQYTATDINGQDVRLRQPATYDNRVPNADGTVDYTKGVTTVRYDANGFPIFNAKADLYLDVSHLNTSNPADHFRAANSSLAEALRADPTLAQQLGLNPAQVNHILKNPPSDKAPPLLTWHHHQDTGRMQLVSQAEHAHFSGGHTGGMRLWGGGY